MATGTVRLKTSIWDFWSDSETRSCQSVSDVKVYKAATGVTAAPLKGLSGFFFPKCWSYSVERVDDGGWPQQPKVFFLKIALLANASPSKLIRLPAGTSASSLQVLFQISLFPHWLNIGWRLLKRLAENFAIPDKRTLYQISAHPITAQLQLRYIRKSEDFLPEYLESVLPALDTSKSW